MATDADLARAVALVDRWWNAWDAGQGMPEPDHSDLVRRIAALVAAERDRCAAHIDVPLERSGREFAAAIRALAVGEGEQNGD